MKKILVVFPTSWDQKQLHGCAPSWENKYTIEFSEPSDEDCPWDYDVPIYIKSSIERYQGQIQGVLSSSDYPGATVAAAIATALGLPGSTPESIISCSHKYYSRQKQAEVAPEATARFYLIDPKKTDGGQPEMIFPCFIKPVKGAFSVMSGRLKNRKELRAFLKKPATREFLQHYVHIFSHLVRQLTDFEVDGGYFLAEQLLHGFQVTVEGFCVGDEVEILGITDSVLHPETKSFARFDYPSSLHPEIQERMVDIAKRVMHHIGLDASLFNIEMIYNPVDDSIYIIEINPRMCGQFADLYQKVDGNNGYEIALALASGERPVLRRNAGRYAMATSFPLRIFNPCRITHSPKESDIQEAEALFPETLIWTEYSAGQDLIDFESLEDGQSCRYGIINVGADTRKDLLQRLHQIQERLGFEFSFDV